MDFGNLVEDFRLPQKGELESWASSLVADLRADLPEGFQSLDKGHMYSDWYAHPHRIAVSFHKGGGCTREVCFQVASKMQRVFGSANTGVDIVYSEERLEGFGDRVIAPHELYVHTLQELIEDKSRIITGTVESMKFKGYVLISTSRGQQVWMPATIGFYSRADSEETAEERLARMQIRNTRATPMDFCRNLAGLIRPAQLAKRFSGHPEEFPTFRHRDALWKDANKIRDELRADISDTSKKEAVYVLCEAAEVSLQGTNLEEYPAACGEFCHRTTAALRAVTHRAPSRRP